MSNGRNHSFDRSPAFAWRNPLVNQADGHTAQQRQYDARKGDHCRCLGDVQAPPPDVPAACRAVAPWGMVDAAVVGAGFHPVNHHHSSQAMTHPAIGMSRTTNIVAGPSTGHAWLSPSG